MSDSFYDAIIKEAKIEIAERTEVLDFKYYEGKTREIGHYGKLRRKYLITSRRNLYTSLLAANKLEQHLYEIEDMAQAISKQLWQVLADESGFHDIDKNNKEALSDAMYTIDRQIEEVILTELINM